MTKLKGLLIISLVVLAAIAAGFIIGFRKTVVERASFAQNGYVLSLDNESDSVSKRNDVQERTTYRSVYPDAVSFHTAAGADVEVKRTSFVHYEDGSIAAMTSGVIADCTGLMSGLVDCYSISAGTVMIDIAGTYSPDGNAEAVALHTFIWKLSDEKYMLCSPTVEFTMPDGTVRGFYDYAELTYISGGAVAVCGANDAFISVADGLSADLGKGIRLNALEMKLTGADGGELTLTGLDADDDTNALMESAARVPVYSLIGVDGKIGTLGSDGESGDAGEEGSNGTAGETGVSGITGGGGSGGADGAGGNVGIGGNTSSEQESLAAMPFALLKELSISSTSIRGVVRVYNEDALQPKDGQIKLYEAEGGELVEAVNAALYNDGVNGTAFSFTSLDPNKEYRLIVSADYSIATESASITGNVDLLNRSVYTDTLGIVPILVSAAEESICASVSKEEWCIVREAWLQLINSDGSVAAEEQLDLTSAQPYVIFDGLIPNTAYTVTLITSFVPNAEISQGTVSHNTVPCMTLKTVPIDVGAPVVAVNDAGFFEVCLDGKLSDPHLGIVRYIYEIMDLNGTVWKTVTGTNSRPIAVYTDEMYIRFGTIYKVRAQVEFFDNEKMNVLDAGVSEEFIIYGDMAPKVSFEPYLVTATKISGAIVINVANVTPIVSDNYPIMIVVEAPGYYYYTQNVESAVSSNDEIRLEFNSGAGIKPETTYRFTVSGYADIYGSGEAVKSEWGGFITATKANQ